MTYYAKTMPSPVGALRLIATDKGLTAILWENDDPERVHLGTLIEQSDHPVLVKTEQQLNDYFAGRRDRFDLPLDMVGTDFRKRVWKALLDIPFGETRSYADIARAVGNPKAARAVGGAINHNPLSIVTPCHRVIGRDGTLTGFAGGLEAKEFLLGHEQGKAPAHS